MDTVERRVGHLLFPQRHVFSISTPHVNFAITQAGGNQFPIRTEVHRTDAVLAQRDLFHDLCLGRIDYNHFARITTNDQTIFRRMRV